MLAVYFCNNTISILSGYFIVDLMKVKPGFQYSFLIPAVLNIFPCAVLYLFFPKKYYASGVEMHSHGDKKEEEGSPRVEELKDEQQ